MLRQNPMTRQELLELAALDLFGLLDEHEAERYTRSFYDAPAAVQDQIIQWQAELASDASLLPDERPRDDLRRRVLSAVARAIAEEDARLGPLASIGRRRPDEALRDPDRRRHQAGSGPLWRAAAFVLGGALVVSAYFHYETKLTVTELIKVARQESTRATVLDLIGSDYESFLKHPRQSARTFRAIEPDYPGTAAVYIIEPAPGEEETFTQAFLLAMGLPTQETSYILQARLEDGTVEMLATFASTGALADLHLDRFPMVLTCATLEVIDASGAVVLRST